MEGNPDEAQGELDAKWRDVPGPIGWLLRPSRSENNHRLL